MYALSQSLAYILLHEKPSQVLNTLSGIDPQLGTDYGLSLFREALQGCSEVLKSPAKNMKRLLSIGECRDENLKTNRVVDHIYCGFKHSTVVERRYSIIETPTDG